MGTWIVGRNLKRQSYHRARKAFYSKLNMKGISDQEHENAQQVSNTLEKKPIDCYHDNNLKTDV